MKVLVHPLHSAPQTDQEGLAGFALHWGPLLKPLLQPGPEPLHDIKVRAAFGEVLLHSETLLSSCRNRVCIPKTRLMILDQMHDLRHATAIAGNRASASAGVGADVKIQSQTDGQMRFLF